MTKINPIFSKFKPQPSVNVFKLEDGGYMFYGWNAEPQRFERLKDLVARIEDYFLWTTSNVT